MFDESSEANIIFIPCKCPVMLNFEKMEKFIWVSTRRNFRLREVKLEFSQSFNFGLVRVFGLSLMRAEILYVRKVEEFIGVLLRDEAEVC